MRLLRLFIRETLERLYEKKVLSEPDETHGEEQDEAITLAGGGVRGHTGPVSAPVAKPSKKKKKKKKSDTGSRAFGGGEYED